MSYTTSTWTTVSVSSIKADHVVVYTDACGAQRGRDANLVLTQIHDETGSRRTILGVVDVDTCEVLPAPDLPGFVGMIDAARWAARARRIELQPR